MRAGALGAGILLVCALSGSLGCAMLRDPVPPGFERIALQAEVARDDVGRLEGDLSAYSTRNAALLGAFVGAPIGAFVGAAGGTGIAIAACDRDSFDLLWCIPGGAAAGGLGGGLLGAIGGALAGSAGGLPALTADQVTTRLGRLEQGRRFDEELLAALRAAVPAERQVDAADAEATVTARLDGLDLRQHRGERLSVRLYASMLQRWETPGEGPQHNTCEYRFTSDLRAAEVWLADQGAAFGEIVTQGLQAIARWMSRDLEAFAAKQKLPETGSDPASCFRG